MTVRVFVDSNILASRTLRDWLFLLRFEAEAMYSTSSSLDVILEAVRAQRRRQPKADGSMTRRLFEELHQHLDEVVDDFEGDVSFEGDDVDDHHVHAAAISAEAGVLLTNNGRDFGSPDDLSYDIYDADDFFCLVDDSSSQHVRSVTRAQALYWTRRAEKYSVPAKPLGVALVDAGCPKFALRVQAHLEVLSGTAASTR